MNPILMIECINKQLKLSVILFGMIAANIKRYRVISYARHNDALTS